jgi:Spy/CpxP family protein refolding chaperone
MACLCRRLLPAVFVLTVVLPAQAQSSASAGASSPSSSRQGQPGRSVQSGQPGQPSRDGQPRGPEPWWRETSPFSKELGLTKEQIDRIEKLFQETRPEFRKLDDNLQKREDMLSRMIKDDSPETLISQQIDRVEGTRAALNKARLLMLVRMRTVLTDPQRAKFETLHTQWQDELRQAQLAREIQERNRKQDQKQKQNPNQKPDPRSAPDRQGRPGE